MALHPKRFYYFNEAFYLRICSADGTDPYITTDTLEFNCANFSGINNQKIMFPIRKSQNQSLWSEVLAMEHSVAMMFRDLDIAIYTALPQLFKKYL